jgi:hypothetical protein
MKGSPAGDIGSSLILKQKKTPIKPSMTLLVHYWPVTGIAKLFYEGLDNSLGFLLYAILAYNFPVTRSCL